MNEKSTDVPLPNVGDDDDDLSRGQHHGQSASVVAAPADIFKYDNDLISNKSQMR